MSLDPRIAGLVGTSWEDAHCGVLAYRALGALGFHVERSDLWLDADIEQARGRSQEILGGGAWVPVDGPPTLGDVILTRAPLDSACPLHVAVVGTLAGDWVLTTTKASGAISVRRASLRAVVGTYRLREPWEVAG